MPCRWHIPAGRWPTRSSDRHIRLPCEGQPGTVAERPWGFWTESKSGCRVRSESTEGPPLDTASGGPSVCRSVELAHPSSMPLLALRFAVGELRDHGQALVGIEGLAAQFVKQPS